ncbi:Na+/H+ antiporter subunit E [Longibacter salinarum]|uniref:Na+/H+ antiporter subunit E n=1 Tax=Longibacter salinarum TaxID=1850348 RepID=A0A2A8CW87_9BACT|nr:Na+/H+ antiporter subunit E [Longibacter salinarum]PEN12857.1 Na+/H+ antiporter subunit E [Longibacter salinarum]
MLATTIRSLVLALIWVSLQGTFTVPNLIFGLLLGAAVTVFSQPIFDRADDKGTLRGANPVRRMYRIVVLFLVFLRELAISSVRVARITVAPTLNIRSAVIEYPLDVTTNREITALSNLITLTPGTMTLDVSSDKKHLYIHSMAIESDDGQGVISDIKRSLEKHVQLAFGPVNQETAE